MLDTKLGAFLCVFFFNSYQSTEQCLSFCFFPHLYLYLCKEKIANFCTYGFIACLENNLHCSPPHLVLMMYLNGDIFRKYKWSPELELQLEHHRIGMLGGKVRRRE